MKPWKVSIGVGLIIVGLYFLFNQKGIFGVFGGAVGIAVGIGLIISN